MKDEIKDLRFRTRQFALAIIRLFSSLLPSTVAQVIGKQILRSGTSLGAHYHEAIHARSNNEFVAKIDLGLQELRETGYWLDLLAGANIVKADQVKNLLAEQNELTAILITISKKIKASYA